METVITEKNMEQTNPTENESRQLDPSYFSQIKNYVVAIGASAGGLDALERFFDALDANSGAVYVVIQHLSPDHKSMMDNLLSRHTVMPVIMAENDMVMEPNHVYLIPPGKNMTVVDNHLKLIPKNPHGLNLPIDLFFTSLANEFRNKSVAAILSGTGSDGSRGAVAINDQGGFLLAQDLDSAKFDGMPRSVISTGLVDAVLTPELMASRIVSHVKNIIEEDVPEKLESVNTSGADPLENILHMLYQVGGVNFNDYKPTTVQRRIERRMQIRHVHTLRQYANLLESDRGEVVTLKRDMLIPVTSFFRDPEMLEFIESTVIPEIIKEHDQHTPIRIWIPGCSTGEEAYTLAILFSEAFDKLKRWPQVKIFATDVEQTYIDVASTGAYAEAIANELSPERLERFFNRIDNRFVVKPEIRQNIIFAKHNLLEDAPFTRMNLVSCRNLLIYFESPAQEKALLRLQYALMHRGFLFLGSSESLGGRSRDFSVVASKEKVYRILRPVTLPVDINRGAIKPGRKSPVRSPVIEVTAESNVIEQGQALLMKTYAPPAILVNDERQLVHVYGDASRLMQIQPGTASFDISKLLIGKLAPVGVALLHKAARENTQFRSEVIEHNREIGQPERIRMTVLPLAASSGTERYFMLSFDTTLAEAAKHFSAETIDLTAESSERIRNLEQELSVMRDSLQATIEELETSNEELQATNEELMASNEELQSTNEELQSVNEELYTVNSENQEKIEILNRLNSDLDNVTRATMIPTVFLDADLKLTRFTPEAGNIFRIRENDVGRPIEDFTHTLDYPGFHADLRQILRDEKGSDREVKTRDDRTWYMMRMLPYFEKPGHASGVVLTFLDVSRLKDAQRFQAVLDSLPEHIALLDDDGQVLLANRLWQRSFEKNELPQLVCAMPGSNLLDAFEKTRTDGELGRLQAMMIDGVRSILHKDRVSITVQASVDAGKGQSHYLIHAAVVEDMIGGILISIQTMPKG